ncbi:Ubiquitin-like-conjugating enzyme Atg3/Atg10 [Abortiporus biennis]
MISTLTRQQFEHACKAYIHKHADPSKYYPSHWEWHEHSYLSGFGYLSYTLEEDIDDAVTPASNIELASGHLYVVYSATFQVPALYFALHHSNGTPLTLDEIVQSPLFRRGFLPNRSNNFALEAPDSSFAMLSQGDHPTLNTPCWYFHPCHTSEVMSEIMKELDMEGRAEEEWLGQWIESWFMVIGNFVNFACISGYK